MEVYLEPNGVSVVSENVFDCEGLDRACRKKNERVVRVLYHRVVVLVLSGER